MKHSGIIKSDGCVHTKEGSFQIPFRGTDEDGYPKVLIDAKSVGGSGSFHAQSIKPFIGMKSEFEVSETGYGYNFVICGK